MMRVFFRTLAVVRRIKRLLSSKNFPEAVKIIKDRCGDFSFASRHDYETFIGNHGFILIFNRASRKQPCLFLTLIALANVTLFDGNACVNIGLSFGESDVTDGHCWLTVNGKALFEESGETEFYDKLSENDGIVYWMRRSSVEYKN